MALNPTLVKHASEDLLLPEMRQNELFILIRKSIDIRISVDNKVYTGKGYIIMTNQRLVFIKNKGANFSKIFSSASFPFLLLSQPYFNQPIFGSNNFQGFILPDSAEKFKLPGQGKFTLYFYNGGAHLFLEYFFKYFARARNEAINAQPESTEFSTLGSEDNAIVDPYDPTRIFITQPETVPLMTSQQEVEAELQDPRTHDTHNAFSYHTSRFFKKVKNAFTRGG